jgi:hypothetical protein
MMKNRSLSFCWSAVLGISALIAAATAHADRVPNDRAITQIRVYTDWAAVLFTPPYDNDVGCPGAASNNSAVIEWRSDPDKKAMFATILAAKVTGQPLGFGILNCWDSYGGGVPMIYRVDLPE